jgi:hypothetical protein
LSDTAIIFAWSILGLGIVAVVLAIVISAEEDIVERRYGNGKRRTDE